MTTWTIKAAKANAGSTNSGYTTPSDTGLRFDDSVTLTSWTPATGSTANQPLRKILSHLQAASAFFEGNMGAGWILVADDGAGTVLWPNRDPL